MTSRRAAAFVLSAGLAVGCGTSSEAADVPAPAPAPRADSAVPCSARSEPPPLDALSSDPSVRSAAVELRGGGRFELFTFGGAPSRTRVGRTHAWLWKTPVSLTVGSSVVVSVPASRARRARLGFTRRASSFGRADRATRFTSCAADTPLFSGEGTVGPVTGWGGSVLTLDRRVCLRLRVSGATGDAVLELPLGRRC